MKSKKVILYFLSLLPISSISFATDFSLYFNNYNQEKVDVEAEFLEKLDSYQLPAKYYKFLREHDIKTSEQLLSEEFETYRMKLVEEYIKDYKDVLLKRGGSLSFG